MTERSPEKYIKKSVYAVLVVIITVLLLCACSDSGNGGAETGNEAAPAKTETEDAPVGSGQDGEVQEDAPEENAGSYEVPEFRDSYFDEYEAEGNEDVLIDLSHCSEGYVSIFCMAEGKIKFQVLKGELTVTYSVVPGIPQIFPLQSGDGHYDFRAVINICDSKYAELYSTGADVVIADPFDPFLRPNQYADYDEESQCVALASQFASESVSAPDFINKVYGYICDNITYDTEKAKTVEPGYLPEPDLILGEGKGICFDYASLAASMLRSQGIPTKIIFGYVEPNDLYHAWNKFYTEEGGWQIAEFSVSGSDWNRIDLTFHANDADAGFIGDGSNYLDAYEF